MFKYLFNKFRNKTECVVEDNNCELEVSPVIDYDELILTYPSNIQNLYNLIKREDGYIKVLYDYITVASSLEYTLKNNDVEINIVALLDLHGGQRYYSNSIEVYTSCSTSTKARITLDDEIQPYFVQRLKELKSRYYIQQEIENQSTLENIFNEFETGECTKNTTVD